MPSDARLNSPQTAWPRRLAHTVRCWFDTTAPAASDDGNDERIDWPRVVPFIGIHLMCLGVIWVGFSWAALSVCLALYALRMFAITAFYHRYFSHRAFRTSRVMQFVFGVAGASCVQRGPCWWAAHHRHHHRHSDQPQDLHSPVQRSFFWSHVGWFLTRRGFRTRWENIPDLAKFPELRWLDRFDIVVPLLLALGVYGLGAWLETAYPGLHTSGMQMLIWGFFLSTVLLFHATVTINSLAHRVGSRRFATRDNSRNNFALALLTFGEGWHNNHHHFPGSARQGFRWWELDITYYGLRAMATLRLIHTLKPVPKGLRRVAGEG